MKRVIGVLVVTLLASVLAMICSVRLVRAQWGQNSVGEIIIHSPERKTYTDNTLSLIHSLSHTTRARAHTKNKRKIMVLVIFDGFSIKLSLESSL
jgi:hypothetical protein